MKKFLEYLYYGILGMFLMLLVVGCAALICEGFLSMSIVAGLAGIGITALRFIITGALVIGLVAGVVVKCYKNKHDIPPFNVWEDKNGKRYKVLEDIYDDEWNELVLISDHPTGWWRRVYKREEFEKKFTRV